MGIVNELGLDRVRSKQELQEILSKHKKVLQTRLSAADTGAQRMAEDQSEFINALRDVIDKIQVGDIDIQTVIQTYGFAFDTQDRYLNFLIEYEQIEKAVEGNGEEAYKIATEIKTRDVQLASIWEDWAVIHGYSTTKQKNGTEQKAKFRSKSTDSSDDEKKKKCDNKKEQSGESNFLKKTVLPIFILIILILLVASVSSLLQSKNMQHPSYMVGTWESEGGTFSDITLYSDGACREEVDGKWYVEGDKLYLSFFDSRWKSFTIISKDEMYDNYVRVHPNHYMKKDNGNPSNITEKLNSLSENNEQGGVESVGEEMKDSDSEGDIQGEVEALESISFLRGSDRVGLAMKRNVIDNFGNTYPLGYRGRANRDENWSEYLLSKNFKKMTGRVVLMNEFKIEEPETSYICIYGDDKLLFESESVTKGCSPQDFSIDISDVVKLKISVSGKPYACLVDTYLYKSAGEDTVTKRKDYEFGDQIYIGDAYWYDTSQVFMEKTGFVQYDSVRDNKGVHYEKGIGGRVNLEDNWCLYRLNSQMSEMTGKIVLNAEVADDSFYPSYVKIFCDGEIVFQSEPVKTGYDGEVFNIDLSGVKDLKVSIDKRDQIRIVDCYLTKEENSK